MISAVISLTACGKNDGGSVTKSENSKTIDTCPNCVFADLGVSYYSGEKRKKIDEYTNDYSSIKYEKGQSKNRFLGLALDSEGKIERGFVCGIEGDKSFCLEGSTDGSTYESNKKIIESIYEKDKCLEGYSMICNGELRVTIYEEGSVSIHSGDGYCGAFDNGSIYCVR